MPSYTNLTNYLLKLIYSRFKESNLRKVCVLFLAFPLNIYGVILKKGINFSLSHPKIGSGLKKFMGVSPWDATNSSELRPIQNQKSFTTGICRH